MKKEEEKAGSELVKCLVPINIHHFRGQPSWVTLTVHQLNNNVVFQNRYKKPRPIIAEQQFRGVDVLFEQHGARQTHFCRGDKLGTRDHVVNWHKPARPDWMSQEAYNRYPDELRVREVKVGKKVLVTTFVSPQSVSKNALGKLFLQRWHVALDLRNI